MASLSNSHIDCFFVYRYLFDTEKDSADSRGFAGSGFGCYLNQV
jgi:hypothetical protein